MSLGVDDIQNILQPITDIQNERLESLEEEKEPADSSQKSNVLVTHNSSNQSFG